MNDGSILSCFAVAYVKDRKVQVITIPINADGSFIFEGKVYGA